MKDVKQAKRIKQSSVPPPSLICFCLQMSINSKKLLNNVLVTTLKFAF